VPPRRLLEHNPVETEPTLLRRFAWLQARADRMKVAHRFSDPDGVTYFIVKISP